MIEHDADSAQVRIDHDAAVAWARKAAQDPRAVILDTETTDLRGYICDIAIIRATDGEVLMNTLVNPGVPIEPGAQAVHGITDAEVARARSFRELWRELRVQLEGRRVLVYNASYDLGRIGAELDRTAAAPLNLASAALGEWECIMLQHAAWVGEWNEYRGGYRWHKLTGGNHRALGDCQAARARLFEMAGLPLA